MKCLNQSLRRQTGFPYISFSIHVCSDLNATVWVPLLRPVRLIVFASKDGNGFNFKGHYILSQVPVAFMMKRLEKVTEFDLSYLYCTEIAWPKFRYTWPLFILGTWYEIMPKSHERTRTRKMLVNRQTRPHHYVLILCTSCRKREKRLSSLFQANVKCQMGWHILVMGSV